MNLFRVLVMRHKVICSLHLLLEQYNVECYLLMQDSYHLYVLALRVSVCVTFWQLSLSVDVTTVDVILVSSGICVET